MPKSGHGADGRLVNCHDVFIKFRVAFKILKPANQTLGISKYKKPVD
jgi:hypothetical protein